MAYKIIPLHSRAQNLSGKVLGKSVVVAPVGRATSGTVVWLCACHCGTLFTCSADALRRPGPNSCGCLRWAGPHGEAGTSEYRIWASMLQRCYNPLDKGFKNYGGRGIGVCASWRSSYAAFIRDMGFRPAPELSIDRTDNHWHYEPTNCTWATRAQQAANKRERCDAVLLTSKSGETRSVEEWAGITGIPAGTIRSRRRAGMLPDLILAATNHNRAGLSLDGHPITISSLASKLGMSYSTLRRRLLSGDTPEELVDRPASRVIMK